MKRKKLISIIFVISTFTIVLLYSLMYNDVSSIQEQLENRFSCKPYDLEFTVSKHSTYDEYCESPTARARFKTSHVFTLYNFNSGTYWFVYDYYMIDRWNGLETGIGDSSVKLTIKKVKGKWIITDWKESYW